MKYSILLKAQDNFEALVFGYFESETLPKNLSNKISAKFNKKITSKLVEGDYICHIDDNHQYIIINCGNEADFNHVKLRKRIKDIGGLLLKAKVKSALIDLPKPENLSSEQFLEQLVLDFDNVTYQLLDFKTSDKGKNSLESLGFLGFDNENHLKNALYMAKGIAFSKTLANLPANICTPSFMADEALRIAKKNKLKVKIYNKAKLKKMGMNALLAVAQGSLEEPRLIEVHYNGSKTKSAPYVLVGKGITFDSGGLTIKPGEAMMEMKYDMAGAASVLSTIKICAEMKLPINIIALLACSENLPSGSAIKPGDIIKSKNGLTIEILNTDAEGRLVLADALTHAASFKPKLVIDVATLTGAAVIALGNTYSAYMTRDDELANLVKKCGEQCLDKAWRLPLDPEYDELLESNFADLINASFDRRAGSSKAAQFLANFTKDYPWIHLDIAGSAWVSGKNVQATGRPVPLLLEILRYAARS